MTTANLMNVSSVKGKVSVQVDASKKLQEENLEVAEIFAGLMNQNVEISNSMAADTSSNMDVSKANGTQSPAQSYERYSYKEKQIDTAKEPSAEEKLEEAGEVLEEAGEKVMDTLCEKYGVDEETIQNLLDDMGLSVLDLLNPQNLVSFIVQLTGVATGEELLLDGNFLSVMETMNHLAGELMNDLNVDMNGLQDLVAQMDMVTDEVDGYEQILEVATNELTAEETLATETVQTTDENSIVEKSADVQQTATKEVQESEVEEQPEIKVEEQPEIKVEEQPEIKVAVREESAGSKSFDTEDSMTGQERGQNENSLFNHNANETMVQTQSTANVSQVSGGQATQQFSSYLSADTVQIMEQVVQQMRVTLSNEVTTMEMQMNPENLGKVYVNISSEKGVVNAQFHATNEVVKEALEAQIATLRESLNQAGVKVDAIEVTIASHEFERNLEQNHQNSEEHMQAQEETTKKRRNLTLDSLDELAGMMTEEETLVAQIMKDNGNSVDFTA